MNIKANISVLKAMELLNKYTTVKRNKINIDSLVKVFGYLLMIVLGKTSI